MTVEAAPPSIVLLPFSGDPLQRLASQLLERQADTLPDLSTTTILIPELQTAPALRYQLLSEAQQRGHTALLGPNILTLGQWLKQFPLPQPVIGQHGSELMLIEALREHHTLFGEGSLWTLADALLELFDELTLNQVGLPNSLLHFQRRVASAYQRTHDENHSYSAMEMETRLVHTLWHAWHAQLQSSRQIDSATAKLLGLSTSLKAPLSGPLYLLEPCGQSRAEHEWLSAMLEKPDVVLFLQGEASGEAPQEGYISDRWIRDMLKERMPARQHQEVGAPLAALLHQIFDAHPTPMPERARHFSTEHPTSPLADHVCLFAADSAEQEARAIETQVRLWLAEGRQNIGIITENRRLARRVRALLERANIEVNDAAGWALSTTAAAATVERWLECVEEDFPWRPLLDLLKSAFFPTGEAADTHLETVYRFEREIVHGDNIGSGVKRYQSRIHERQQLLGGQGEYQPMLSLLASLESAALPLSRCCNADSQPAAHYLTHLQQSLQTLGLSESLSNDAAGQRLLDEIHQMQAAAAAEPYAMSWPEFRTWFGRTLERYNFRPPVAGHTVRLMNLAQSALQRFDVLILAGTEQQHLPGGASPSPFFNDQVRRDLGLTTHEQKMARRFHLFRRLPESCGSLLITYRREENGETIPLSPWVELLVAFHHLAWGELPSGDVLRQLLKDNRSEVTLRDAPLPDVEGRPAPQLPTACMPQTLSASSHQQLIDCPYLFFAAQGLRLAPPDTIREALEKADYGEKVHRCLQAFHDGVEGLPGPFAQLLSTANRDDAIALMIQIARAEFGGEESIRFEEHAWLMRWQELIPHYIDWQLERAKEWRLLRHEEQSTRNDLFDFVTLRGRLDRLDEKPEGIAVIDYKTGAVAKETDVMQGEAVQLPVYALLADNDTRPVIQVEYLRLNDGVVTSPVVLQGEALTELREATRARLSTLIKQLREGMPLPAWGDEKTCSRCDMEGLCRRTTWPL